MHGAEAPSKHSKAIDGMLKGPRAYETTVMQMRAARLHGLEVVQQVLRREAGLAHADVHVAGLVRAVLHLAALEVAHRLRAARPPVQRSRRTPTG